MSRIVIGERERVAAEVDLLEDVPPRQKGWMFGRLSLWVGGILVGRHDEVGALTVALTTFPDILGHRGERSRPHLMALPAVEVARRVHEGLYVDSGQSDVAIRRAEQEYTPLLVLPRGFDLFDGWMGVMIEDEEIGRFVVRGPDGQVREARIQAGEFDRVIDALLSELERISGQIRAL